MYAAAVPVRHANEIAPRFVAVREDVTRAGLPSNLGTVAAAESERHPLRLWRMLRTWEAAGAILSHCFSRISLEPNPAVQSSPMPVCRVRQAKCREAWSRENDRRVYQYYRYARILVQL